MAKQSTKGAAKGAKSSKSKGTKKRKVVVESVGEAHISASFNNILVSLTNKKVMSFLGLRLGKWDLEDLRKTLPMLLNWRLKMLVKWLMMLVYAR